MNDSTLLSRYITNDYRYQLRLGVYIDKFFFLTLCLYLSFVFDLKRKKIN